MVILNSMVISCCLFYVDFCKANEPLGHSVIYIYDKYILFIYAKSAAISHKNIPQ